MCTAWQRPGLAADCLLPTHCKACCPPHVVHSALVARVHADGAAHEACTQRPTGAAGGVLAGSSSALTTGAYRGAHGLAVAAASARPAAQPAAHAPAAWAPAPRTCALRLEPHLVLAHRMPRAALVAGASRGHGPLGTAHEVQAAAGGALLRDVARLYRLHKLLHAGGRRGANCSHGRPQRLESQGRRFSRQATVAGRAARPLPCLHAVQPVRGDARGLQVLRREAATKGRDGAARACVGRCWTAGGASASWPHMASAQVTLVCVSNFGMPRSANCEQLPGRLTRRPLVGTAGLPSLEARAERGVLQLLVILLPACRVAQHLVGLGGQGEAGSGV